MKLQLKQKIKFFLVVLCFSYAQLAAQTTYTWTGAIDNDWQEAGNWSPSRTTTATSDIIVFDNGNNITVENIPTQTIRGLSVTDGTKVTIDAIVTATSTLSINGPSNTNNLFVESGAGLTIGDASTLNLNFVTTSNQRGLIEGELAIKAGNFRTTSASNVLVTVAANAVLKHSGGSITASLASMEFKNNSQYQHLFTTENSAIPLATWEPNSTVSITEITTATSISGINGVTFGNFIYNCPNQTSAILSFGVTTGDVFFKGNFTFVSSGSGEVRFATDRANIHFEKPFLFQGGVLDLTTYTSTSTNIYFIYENFTQTGGTLKQSGSSVSQFRFVGNNVNYSHTGGTIDNTFINYFLPADAQLTVNSNITLSSARTFIVSDGAVLILNNGTIASASSSGGTITISGTLDLKTNVIQGSGAFVVNTTATVICAHPDGLNSSGASGAIQVTGTRTFNAADYVFNSTAAQVTGNGLSTVKNLTIDNAVGVTQSSSSVRITELLTLTSGDYQIAGSSGQTHTLRLDGPVIAGTATHLKSTEFSDLFFGGSASSIVIPSSILKLNALILNNTVTLGSSIELHSSSVALSLLSSNLLYLDDFDITLLSTTATISTSSTTFGITPFVVISGTGQLRKNFATGSSSAFTFPIGVNDGVLRYTPFRITFSANSLERIIGVKVTSGAHPQNNSDGTQTNFASRYWSVTDSEEGNGTYEYSNILLYYTTNNPTDVNGNANIFTAFRWTNTGSASGTWYELPSSVNTSSRFVSASATFNEINGKLGGSDFAIRNTPANRYLWIGGSSGDYDDPLNWNTQSNGSGSFRFFKFTDDELQFDNTGTVLVEDIPTETISKLIVTGSSNVTLQALSSNLLYIAGPSNQLNLFVASNATLQMSSQNTLQVRSLTNGNQLMEIAGKFILNAGTFNISNVSTTKCKVSGTGIFEYNNGTITSTVASLEFESGSTFHYRLSINGTIPLATWDANATLLITDITTATTISGISGSSLGNVVYNCPNQTAAEVSFAISANNTVFKGDFLVRNTGNGILNLKRSSTSTFLLNIGGDFKLENGEVRVSRSRTLNIILSGNFEQSGGNLLYLPSGGTSSTFTIQGDFKLSGGTFDFANVNSLKLDLEVNGNYIQTGGTITQSSGTTRSQIIFAGNNTTYNQTGGTVVNDRFDYAVDGANASLVLNNNITLTAASSFSVVQGQLTLENNASIIDGAGTFTTNNTNATLIVEDVNGLVSTGTSGPIQTGTRVFGLTSNYVFSASASQVTGSGFDGGRNVTINNANGVTQSNNLVTVTNLFTLSAGDYDVEGSSGNTKTLQLNGPNIVGTQSLLKVNQWTALGFGGSSTGIQIPSHISDLFSLFVSNAQGVSLQANLDLHSSAAGVVDFTTSGSGKLILGSYNLRVLSPSATILNSNVSKYIVATGTGQLIKKFGTSGTTDFLFPVGDFDGTLHYSPVRIEMTSNSDDRFIGIRVVNQAPNGASGDYINRYWVFTDDMDGVGSYTYSNLTQFLTAKRVTTEVVGQETALGLHFGDADNNTWDRLGSFLVSSNTNNAIFRLLQSVSIDFGNSITYGKIGGNDFTLKNSASQVYTWTGSVNQQFSVAGNWSPQRDVPYINDILVFDGNQVISATILDVPTQSIGQLRVINNADYALEIGTSAPQTFTMGHPSFYASNPYNTNSPNVLEIESGSILKIQSANNRKFTFNFGVNPVADYAVAIAGDLVIEANTSNTHEVNMLNLSAALNRVSGRIVNNGGFFTSQLANTFFENGSFYIHNRNGGTLPAADWHPNGTFLVNGVTATLPSAQNTTIITGHFIWDNASQTSTNVMANLINLQVLGNLELLNGTLRISNNNIKVSVAGNMVNNSDLIMGTVGTLEFNGNTGNQQVSGSGRWESNATLVLVNNLIINNTASNGSVNFNNLDVVANRTWILENGVFNAQNLTIGNNNTINLFVRNGRLGIIPSFSYNSYNITYDGDSDLVTSVELPDSTSPTNGFITISGAAKKITLDKSTYINTLNIAANNEFDLGNTGLVLGFSQSTTNITSTGTITLNGHTENTLRFLGTTHTFLFSGTLTNNEVPKIELLNNGPLILRNSIEVTNKLFISNRSRIRIYRSFTLNISGIITGDGFIESENNDGILNLSGTQGGSIGKINLFQGAQEFRSFSINRTGTSPSVTISGNLTFRQYDLQSGVVLMDSFIVTNKGNVASMASTVGNENAYFAFNSWGAGFVWEVPSATAPGSYRWPIGMGSSTLSMPVSGFRPVTITIKVNTPNAIVTLKAGIIEHDNETYYGPANIPSSDNRADYLVVFSNLESLGNNLVDVSLAYQNTDFSQSAPSNASIYLHEGIWKDMGVASQSSVNGNSVLTQTNVVNMNNPGVRVLALAETFTDPTENNTWNWIGKVSESWDQGINWSPNSVPNDSLANVIINNPNALFMPYMFSDTRIKNLEVQHSNTLVLASITTEIFGNFLLNGDMQITKFNKIKYAGRGNQLVAGLTYWDLELSGNKGNNQVTFSTTDTIEVFNEFLVSTSFTGGGFSTSNSVVRLLSGMNVPSLSPYGTYSDLLLSPKDATFISKTACSSGLYTSPSTSFRINAVQVKENQNFILNHVTNSLNGGNDIADYTWDSSLFISLAKGNEYELTCDWSYAYSTTSRSRNKFRAWIDYNGDGIYSDSEEIAVIGATNLGAYTQKFTVPNNIRSGNFSMRLRYLYTSDNTSIILDPCAVYATGEIHEYTVVIENANQSLTKEEFVLVDDAQIQRNLMIDSFVTFKDNGKQLSGGGVANGKLEMRKNSKLLLSSTNTTASSFHNAGPFPLYGTYDIDVLSTVEYAGEAAQEIYAVPGDGYGGVLISTNQTAHAKTASNNFKIRGELELNNANARLFYHNSTITVLGNIINKGSITGNVSGAGAGKLIFEGNKNQMLTSNGNAVVGNLSVNKTTGSQLSIKGNGLLLVEGETTLNNATLMVGFAGDSLLFKEQILVENNSELIWASGKLKVYLEGDLVLNGGKMTMQNNTVLDANADFVLSDNSIIHIGFGQLLLKENPVFSNGKKLSVESWVGLLGAGPSKVSKIFFGTSNAGLTSAQLGQIKFAFGNQVYDALYWPTGEVIPNYLLDNYLGGQGKGDDLITTEPTELDGNEPIVSDMVFVFGAIKETQFLGQPFDVALKFVTAKGAVVPSYDKQISISLLSHSSNANLLGTKTINTVNGFAFFNDLALDKVGENFQFNIISDTFDLLSNLVSVYSVYFGDQGRGDTVASLGPVYLGEPIWISTTSNDWNVGSNWSYGTIPLEGTGIIISPDATHNLKLDQNRNVKWVDFSGADLLVETGDFVLSLDTVVHYDSKNYIKTNGSGGVSIALNSGKGFEFPVGLSTYNPVEIINNTTSRDSFKVSVIDEVKGQGKSGRALGQNVPHVSRTWFISKNSGSSNSGNGVDMNFFFDNNQKRGNIQSLRLFHFDNNLGWDPQSGGQENSLSTAKGGGTGPRRMFAYTNYKGTFSPFALGDDAQLLPVEFLSFTVTHSQTIAHAAQLDWSTSAEVNNSHFEVEWSTNGKDWILIGSVNGNGSVNDISYYQFVHANTAQLNYYRLKQVDFDGNIKYSPIRSLLFNDINPIPYAILYPNPSDNLFYLKLIGASQANYQIFDMAGRIVLHGSFNEIIEFEGLKSGVYQVKIDFGNKIDVLRVVICD